MTRITIYHNNRCGKSRKALEVLQQSGKAFDTVLYLQDPPSVSELAAWAAKLGGVEAMVRKKETIYTELFSGRKPSEKELLDAMASHPILLERPLVLINGQPLIVRSDEAMERLRVMLEGGQSGG